MPRCRCRTSILSPRGPPAQCVYFHDGDRVTIACYLGEPKHPAWYHNLRAHPEVVFGGEPPSSLWITPPRRFRNPDRNGRQRGGFPGREPHRLSFIQVAHQGTSRRPRTVGRLTPAAVRCFRA
ncbi:nitroreductase/quinone reductase family protein [Nonomuraea africana]|uniref:nitroreductase/quinone reductase family protein n=1 Tax=Nonomuraea africana TaxID=46171 RepID=UPI00178A2189|nr:nitroreductase/quinone reductase family protein [Nonomuraea africana]